MTEKVHLTLTFLRERETKNTVRFTEQYDAQAQPFVGTLYLRKEGVAALGNPNSLVVRVEAGD
jgi:hypothetical protein